VNAHLPETALEPVAAFDGDDSCTLPRTKLFEGHGGIILITILIIKRRLRDGGSFSAVYP
jgi:hypothetical protein